MAAAPADSATRGSGADGGYAAVNSPKSRRSHGGAAGAASPWTQVVRGADSGGETLVPVKEGVVPPVVASASSFSNEANLSAEAQVEQPEGGDNAGKKPAWNKPPDEEFNPVMDAASWPALSDAAKASPKSSSSDSLKALSDGSLPALQGMGTSSTQFNKQVVATSANLNSTPNHVTPMRQKSMKRGGGSTIGGVLANGGYSHVTPSPQDSVANMEPNKQNIGSTESSPRDHSHNDQRAGFRSQSHGGDNQHHRNSYRRGNGGQNSSYGARREQDRGNQERNQHNINLSGRDNHLQPQRGFSRGYVRPSLHAPAAYVPQSMPVAVRPFGSPIVYPDMASPMIYVPAPPLPESIRAVPIVSPISPHPMFFAVPDPQLHAKIVNQIDYYFSNENLVKDDFLRQKMDDQGWVPITLIAGFPKVKSLTDNIQFILEALRTSTVVEVQGDKVRKRNDWIRWLWPAPGQESNLSSPVDHGRSSHDILTSQLQSVSLGESSGHQARREIFVTRSSSGEFNSHIQQHGGDSN